ncbi:MAG: hypothetical protein U9O78_04335 [Patescibacteria group bacterium]|nr:hypothetical protein [Patescibacteria group bacterium]
MSSQARLSATEMKPDGLSAREYAKFRSPREDEVVIATEVEGVASYPASVNATSKDETTVISAPGADKCIRIKTLMVNNVGASQLAVSFQEGTSGDEKFKNSMPADGAMWNMNLVGAFWILKPNTQLCVNLGAIGNVNVQIGYDIVEAITSPELTESVSISEDLETNYGEGHSGALTESLSIAESLETTHIENP